MVTRPRTLPSSRRQRVITGNGTVLERQPMYLPPKTWDALQTLAITAHRSGSQIIESLIEIAARGNPVKENPVDPISPSST